MTSLPTLRTTTWVWTALSLCVGAVSFGQDEEKAPEPEGTRAVKIKADHLKYDHGHRSATATGHIVVESGDVVLTGDRLEADLKEEFATLSGNVTLTVKKQAFRGDRITFDLRERGWHLTDASGSLTPEFLQADLRGSLHVRGREIGGSEEGASVKRGRVTSCSLEEPHYCVRAREITVYPGDRVIARGVGFYVGERRLFSASTVSLSLRPGQQRRSIVPIVGSNEIEGYFVKTTYDYFASERELGSLYLDLMQKRGIGLGTERQFSFDNDEGTAYIYHLRDRVTGDTELDGRLLETHQFSPHLVSDLTVDYTSNNSFWSGKFSNLNSDLAFSYKEPTFTSDLMLRDTRTKSDYSSQENLMATWRHSQRFGERLGANISADYRRSDFFEESAPDEELNYRLELTDKRRFLDWTFRLEQRQDLDGASYPGDDTLSALNRSPEVVLYTDSMRTKKELFGVFPSALSLSLGEFKEYPEKTSLFRTYLQYDLQDRSQQVTANSTLRYSGTFRQFLYSDDTAQYALNYRARWETKFSDQWNASLNYSKQQPAGFSPFRYDYVAPYDSIDGNLSLQQGESLRMNLSTGFDFDRSIYRDLIARIQYRPNDTCYASLSTGYDIENGEWRDFLTRLRVLRADRLHLNITSRYSPFYETFSRVSTSLDWKLSRKWRLEWLGGYNGLIHDFDYNQVRLTRDLHCWQAFLTYDDQRRELRLDLAIKALPGFDTRFGIGANGQVLDTSSGELY